MSLTPNIIKMYNSIAITDEILAMSQLPKWSDEKKISSGVSRSQRGVNLIWILQYSYCVFSPELQTMPYVDKMERNWGRAPTEPGTFHTIGILAPYLDLIPNAFILPAPHYHQCECHTGPATGWDPVPQLHLHVPSLNIEPRQGVTLHSHWLVDQGL
jgi:hypothetical protein